MRSSTLEMLRVRTTSVGQLSILREPYFPEMCKMCTNQWSWKRTCWNDHFQHWQSYYFYIHKYASLFILFGMLWVQGPANDQTHPLSSFMYLLQCCLGSLRAVTVYSLSNCCLSSTGVTSLASIFMPAMSSGTDLGLSSFLGYSGRACRDALKLWCHLETARGRLRRWGFASSLKVPVYIHMTFYAWD